MILFVWWPDTKATWGFVMKKYQLSQSLTVFIASTVNVAASGCSLRN